MKLLKYIPLLLLFAVSTIGLGQDNGETKKERREKIEAQKIAFISKELSLTAEEAQLFWPLHNEYEAEIHAVRKERKKYHHELKRSEDISDDRAYELTELIFTLEKKESDVRLKYLVKFSEIVGKKKAAQLYMAEQMFKRELLRKLRDEGMPPPPPHEGRP